MANTSLLQSVHSQFLAPSEAFKPCEVEAWEVANNFYALYPKQGRKVLFRSKSVTPDYEGQAVSVSRMERDGEEFLTVSLHPLGTEDVTFTGIGFASVNTEEAFQATGVFAGGRLQDDSPLRKHGYSRHQLIIKDQVMSLIVF
jgi:hypothetical protein